LMQHSDGVFFVELAPITETAMVPSAIAVTLRLREATDRPVLDTVTDALRDRDMLLVLDNFEQLQDAAPAVATILAAAPKLRVLTPDAILGRLGSRLAFLRGGARDLPARQQTLREAIDWSYQLLAAPDQARLRRLGTFVGGFTIAAAEELLSQDEPGVDAVEALESLADQSLIRRLQGEHGEHRLAMLETIREFALERLAEAGEMDELRRRHAQLMLATIERLEPRLASSSEALDAVTHDH